MSVRAKLAKAAVGVAVATGSLLVAAGPAHAESGCASWGGGTIGEAPFGWVDACISPAFPYLNADAYFHYTGPGPVPGDCQINIAIYTRWQESEEIWRPCRDGKVGEVSLFAPYPEGDGFHTAACIHWGSGNPACSDSPKT